MLKYGKMAQTAVAVASRLSELYSNAHSITSSLDIAKNRRIPQPAVAKILTILARCGLITGAPGPGGGYRLARSPSEISLFDIVYIFEQHRRKAPCPIGPQWCGRGKPCVLHDKFAAIQKQNEKFLKTTHLGLFTKKSEPSPRKRLR